MDLNVNGKNYTVNVPDDTPLLWVLRDVIGLTGTKYGCGVEMCGACTVFLDGTRYHACAVDMTAIAGRKVTTVEGLTADKTGSRVAKAWLDLQVPQCGYCQPGMMMRVTAFLKQNPNPTDAQIDAQILNICCCGTYQRIRAAIHKAAKG
jgi:isoquinoline 1-oxidoreductase alpha subunit